MLRTMILNLLLLRRAGRLPLDMASLGVTSHLGSLLLFISTSYSSSGTPVKGKVSFQKIGAVFRNLVKYSIKYLGLEA